jgi:hypothetical protein
MVVAMVAKSLTPWGRGLTAIFIEFFNKIIYRIYRRIYRKNCQKLSKQIMDTLYLMVVAMVAKSLTPW